MLLLLRVRTCKANISAAEDPDDVVVVVDSIDGHGGTKEDADADVDVLQADNQQVQMKVRGARRTRKQSRPSKVDEEINDVLSRCITSALHKDE